jgi:RNA polymerase sigma-70 factor (ECF subfamily)
VASASVRALNTKELASILPAMLPELWAFAFRLAGNEREAEDLVHRACVCGLELAHRMPAGTSPLGWMLSIIETIWIDDKRKLSNH